MVVLDAVAIQSGYNTNDAIHMYAYNRYLHGLILEYCDDKNSKSKTKYVGHVECMDHAKLRAYMHSHTVVIYFYCSSIFLICDYIDIHTVSILYVGSYCTGTVIPYSFICK